MCTGTPKTPEKTEFRTISKLGLGEAYPGRRPADLAYGALVDTHTARLAVLGSNRGQTLGEHGGPMGRQLFENSRHFQKSVDSIVQKRLRNGCRGEDLRIRTANLRSPRHNRCKILVCREVPDLHGYTYLPESHKLLIPVRIGYVH